MTIDPAGTPRSAEIAFLVEEDFRRHGLAGRILKQLAHLAREKGVSQFEAEVLPQNKAMLAVFSRGGLPMKQSSADGVTPCHAVAGWRARNRLTPRTR